MMVIHLYLKVFHDVLGRTTILGRMVQIVDLVLDDDAKKEEVLEVYIDFAFHVPRMLTNLWMVRRRSMS